mmetsp:Transcript_32850/g.55062  ORF Transcript_32850/g.55062 Transcript_32850/m.55062 type:complete len:87 (+) Transcript_32850:782-1042(+)
MFQLVAEQLYRHSSSSEDIRPCRLRLHQTQAEELLFMRRTHGCSGISFKGSRILGSLTSSLRIKSLASSETSGRGGNLRSTREILR